MSSPVIFGANNTSNNLQNAELLANGMLLANDGPKNLISNGTFENGTTTGWGFATSNSLINGIPVSVPNFSPVPPFISPTLSITATTTNPLSGNYSLSFADTNYLYSGNSLVTTPLSVDESLRAKVLTFRMNYKIVTGTLNMSGTSASTLGVAVYDVTNSTWLPVVGNFPFTQSSGVGIATGTFQTGITTASIRLMIYSTAATATPINIYFDDFYIGPQQTQIGVPVTDWQSYAPTFSGLTVTSNVSRWRRVGSDLEVQGSFAIATVGSAPYSVSLPTGLFLDSTKLINNTTSQPGTFVGLMMNSHPSVDGTELVTAPATSTSVIYTANYLSSPTTHLTPTTTGLDASGTISYSFKVPISGWSSNTQMSNDTDTRVIAASGTGGTTGTTITNWTKTQDNSAMFNYTTGIGTIPVSGYYLLSLVCTQNTGAGNGVNVATIYKNSTLLSEGHGFSNTGTNGTGTAVALEFFNAGDTFKFGSNASFSLSSVTNFSVLRLSGPSTIAATETVTARYTDTSGIVLPTSISVFKFNTKDFDSHNGYNSSTGIYTVPSTGRYIVNAKIRVATSQSPFVRFYIYKNGVSISTQQTSTGTTDYTAAIFDTINCNAGDTLAIYIIANAGSALVDATANVLTISRVGN